jgi:hypothetical protein
MTVKFEIHDVSGVVEVRAKGMVFRDYDKAQAWLDPAHQDGRFR